MIVDSPARSCNHGHVHLDQRSALLLSEQVSLGLVQLGTRRSQSKLSCQVYGLGTIAKQRYVYVVGYWYSQLKAHPEQPPCAS